MIDELIKTFARDNFGPHYRVAPQGQNKTIQPLTLIVKNTKPWFKEVARPSPKTVLEELECFLKPDHPHLKTDFRNLAKDRLRNGPVIKTSKGAFASNARRTEIGVTEHFKVGVTKQHDLGELNLGNLQEEYYRDTGLRDILHKAYLDGKKMRPYEKDKLYIITGVVYSDKLRVDGERRQEDTIDAEAKVPMPFLEWIENLAAIKAVIKKVKTPAPPIAKTYRSPLLFTYARVEYDKDQFRLQLKKGQYIGVKLSARDAVADGENVPTDATEDDELTADDLADAMEFIELDEARDGTNILEDLFQSSEDNPKEKLDVMVNFIRNTRNREEMKTRASFFLSTVNFVMTGNRRSMRTELPLSKKDRQMMLSAGLEIEKQPHNSAKVIRVSDDNLPRVRSYGLIFQHLQGIEESEWEALEELARQLAEESN